MRDLENYLATSATPVTSIEAAEWMATLFPDRAQRPSATMRALTQQAHEPPVEEPISASEEISAPESMGEFDPPAFEPPDLPVVKTIRPETRRATFAGLPRAAMLGCTVLPLLLGAGAVVAIQRGAHVQAHAASVPSNEPMVISTALAAALPAPLVAAQHSAPNRRRDSPRA
ncbi:MAG: hypothetical protein QM756_04345 [Polyangiaceae bacterium]